MVSQRSFFLPDGETSRTAKVVQGTRMPEVYERCKRNVAVGYRVHLVLPDLVVIGTRQNAEAVVPGRIMVDSIEAFVGRNIEEQSGFSRDRLAHGFKRLLELYNARVDAVELDKSMLIELPKALTRVQ